MSQLEKQIDQLFARWDRPDSPGAALAVVRDGAIIYSRGYGMADLERGVPITPGSVFDIASTSKQFTAFVVLLLVHEGKVGLDEDIRTYLPEMPEYGRPITVRHLLHHTSGIRDYLDLMELAGMSWEYDYDEQELVDLLARQKKLNFRPGEEHRYSNSNYFLLAEIIRRASGQTLGELARERIFEPLGMAATRFYDDYTAIVPNRAIGYTRRKEGGYAIALFKFDVLGDGGVLTSVEDMARWDANFYDNRLEGGAELLAQMLTVGTLNDSAPSVPEELPEADAAPDDRSADDRRGAQGAQLDYAGGLVVDHYRGLPMVHHAGGWAGYSAELIRFPEQRLSVVCLSNLDEVPCPELARQVAGLYLAAEMEPAEHADRSAVELPEETLAAYTGAYRSQSSGTVYRLALEEGHLAFRHPQGFSVALVPLGADRFHTAAGGWIAFAAEFEPAEPGQPRRFLLTPEQGNPVTLQEIKLSALDAERLAEYAGRYYSSELRVAYHFLVADNKLCLRIGRYGPTEALEHVGGDSWQRQAATLRFTRNRADQVRGLAVQVGRGPGLRFRKRKG